MGWSSTRQLVYDYNRNSVCSSATTMSLNNFNLPTQMRPGVVFSPNAPRLSKEIKACYIQSNAANPPTKGPMRFAIESGSLWVPFLTPLVVLVM